MREAKDVTTSVFSKASGDIKRDATRMLNLIKSEESLINQL